MSIKGFEIDGVVKKYDYQSLDNLPNLDDLSSGSTPQLVEGIIYDVDDEGNIDLSTRGLSANRDAVPTGRGAWIEGNGANGIDIMNANSLGYPLSSKPYLSVTNSNVGKVTTTTAKIYIPFSNSIPANSSMEKIQRYSYFSVIFEDETDKTYYVQRSTMLINGDYAIELQFSFVPNQSTFDATTSVEARYIKSLIAYPEVGRYSHSEGQDTLASAYCSHAEGYTTKASGKHSHSEGYETTASGEYSHAEGCGTTASYNSSHAEGEDTTASYYCSHAEGCNTTATNYCSHSEGEDTTASGERSHAEGYGTTASFFCSHSEGYNTNAKGSCSHSEGNHTIAKGENQHAQGRYNIEDTGNKYAHIVGNGADDDSRSNAHTLDWDGNSWYAGSVEAVDGLILHSITEGSTKRFKITVNDTGTLTATEITA